MSVLTSLDAMQAKRIALVQHINLVKLIRYYEDSHQQLLVYDYIPNGSVGNHLYGNFTLSLSLSLPSPLTPSPF